MSAPAAAPVLTCDYPMITSKFIWRCVGEHDHEENKHYYVRVGTR